MVVRAELEALGHSVSSVELGEAETAGEMTDAQKSEISARFLAIGFELIDEKHGRLSERIKTLIIQWVHHSGERPKVNLSEYLSQHIPLEYNYLSNLFSETEKTTIEKFYIAQKIERVRELLTYGELSLSEIADSLGYGSAAYLSAQFKKVTGMTPGQYKRSAPGRNSLDSI